MRNSSQRIVKAARGLPSYKDSACLYHAERTVIDQRREALEARRILGHLPQLSEHLTVVESLENILPRRLSLLCFCHLRWNFVYQRPQHLLTRCQIEADTHVWEEPVFEDRPSPMLSRVDTKEGVRVLTPLLPESMRGEAAAEAQRHLLDCYLKEQNIRRFISWYYTPMALCFSGHLRPAVTVYDCMDELSAFAGAPPELVEEERRLFEMADIVFAGGASLFESKKKHHPNVHLLPSSIDFDHFAKARGSLADPPDQENIPHPRIGFYGVLDERLDQDLLKNVAELHPDWHLILIGPIVKIDEGKLPRAANLHYLGHKAYTDLPLYLSNWDVAMLPFACNTSTRFISPTKTPEYLAAAKPVVSTPINDVVKPYGELGFVKIAGDAITFAQAIGTCLKSEDGNRQSSVDQFLASNSWDKTFDEMWKEIQRHLPPEPHVSHT
jgi:glycosyltransferase involved in cell wall biosynthesis